jgi:hypothetical protein
MSQSQEFIHNAVLEHVVPDGPELPKLAWDADLGMLVDPNIKGPEVWVAGFAVPYLPGGDTPRFNDRTHVRPVVAYADVPRSMQNVDQLSKGVGTRLYTDAVTAQSGSAVQEPGAQVGLYSVDLTRERILDWRGRQTSAARQIVRHAVQQAFGLVAGTEEVANWVHENYGDAAAVRMDTPPRGRCRLQREGAVIPGDIEPGFLILRSRDTVMRRLGRVTLPTQ